MDDEEEFILEDVPEIAEPLRLYVEDCMHSITKEALIKVGEHGGYIDPTDHELTDTSFKVYDDRFYDSDAITLSPNSDSYIPYWFYQEGKMPCTDCSMDSKMPSLDNIEEQIETYVLREIPACIDGFKSFKEIGYDIEEDDMQINAIIGREDVTVNLRYPIEIKKEDTKVDVETFQTNFDLNLYDIFLLGYLLTSAESNYQFLEWISRTLIDYHSGIDRSKLPPYYGSDNSPSTVSWIETDVKKKMRELFSTYTPFIQINGTRDALRLTNDDPGLERMYDLFFIEYLAKEFPNLKVKFFYNYQWDMYFDITPNNGGSLQPDSHVNDDPGFGNLGTTYYNIYEFFYDYAFPVLVIIEDNESMKGELDEDYKFMFALETNILNNRNLLQWNLGDGTQPAFDPSRSFSGEEIIEIPGTCSGSEPDIVCEPTGTAYFTYDECAEDCVEEVVIDTSFHSSMMCNKNQFLSGNITIITKDLHDHSPTEDIDVLFRCGNYRTCSIGRTSLESGISKLESRFPICYGDAYIILQNEDYVTERLKTSTEYDVDLEFEIPMEKYKELDVFIKKKFFDNLLYLNETKNISRTDYVVVMFEEILENEDELTRPNMQTVVYDMQNDEVENHIKLGPGKYKIRANYLDYDGAIIPASCYRFCSNFDTSGNCIDFEFMPEESIEINPVMLGGLIFNGDDAYFEVTHEMLENNDNLLVYVLSLPPPNCISKCTAEHEVCLVGRCITPDESMNVEETSIEHADILQPIFFNDFSEVENLV